VLGATDAAGDRAHARDQLARADRRGDRVVEAGRERGLDVERVRLIDARDQARARRAAIRPGEDAREDRRVGGRDHRDHGDRVERREAIELGERGTADAQLGERALELAGVAAGLDEQDRGRHGVTFTSKARTSEPPRLSRRTTQPCTRPGDAGAVQRFCVSVEVSSSAAPV